MASHASIAPADIWLDPCLASASSAPRAKPDADGQICVRSVDRRLESRRPVIADLELDIAAIGRGQVRAGRRQRHRHLEVQGRATIVGPRHSRDGDRPPEQLTRPWPGRRRRSRPGCRELRTARPSSVNGGTTTTSKPSRRPSSASASGVPRRSNPNAASGVIRKPASSTRARIAPDERVVGRLAQRLVEVLDDRDRDAGRGEALEALVRVEQERRRRARRTSSGWWSNVMTAGRAPRCAASRDEVLEQVGVAAVEPVEHADDHEQPAVARVERLDPARRRPSVAPSFGIGARLRSAGGVDEHLVRAPAGRRCAAAIATSAPPGPTSR